MLPLGSVSGTAVERQVLLAYDDIYSVEYMHQQLLPYWRIKYDSFGAMLSTAEQEYPEVQAKSTQLDEKLTADLTKVGGAEYADISILAYRQAFAAHKLVEDANGAPFFMPKENFSNGLHIDG